MIFETLQRTGLPCAFGNFDEPQEPPYLVYIGGGQDTFGADNTWYHRQNSYQVEYYFTWKDEAIEETIEQTLLTHGFMYQKSEDIYIESENLYVIYYQI